MTYNPPYYEALIEGYGFKKAQDLLAYQMFREEGIPDIVSKLAEFTLEDTDLVV
ncbi:unnamed protein product, partial [marine sediment metagenome]